MGNLISYIVHVVEQNELFEYNLFNVEITIFIALYYVFKHAVNITRTVYPHAKLNTGEVHCSAAYYVFIEM